MDSRLTTILAAVSYAARRHHGQYRKDDRTPYAAHPMRVLFIVRDVLGVTDPDTLAAAVLHDIIEDTATDRDSIARRFGETVAGYVACLSKDMRLPEHERERRYFADLAEAPLAVKLCKLGDTLDNLSDVAELKESAQRKAARKARQVLDTFEGTIPGEYAHACDLIRARVAAIEGAQA